MFDDVACDIEQLEFYRVRPATADWGHGEHAAIVAPRPTCPSIECVVDGVRHGAEPAVSHEIDKNIPLGVLTKANMVEAIEFAETINAKAIHPNFALVTRDNVKLAHAKGYDVNVWTVNDEDTIKRMKDYGVDAIISDCPDKV